jgi:hypothetical protein
MLLIRIPIAALLCFLLFRLNWLQGRFWELGSPTGGLLNGAAIDAQRVFVGAVASSLVGFLLIRPRSILTLFSLCLLLASIFYGQRLTHYYIFQDDWFHVIAVLRGGLKGLFIPFVDHVTPIWRIIHWVPLQLFGGHKTLAIFPYLGVINIALVGTVLASCLARLKAPFPWLWALLLVTYPGYPSVMYWISTNAVALSAAFGIIAITLQAEPYLFPERATKSRNETVLWQAKILLFCCLSFLTWTTGLVFPIVCGLVAVSELLITPLTRDNFVRVFRNSLGASFSLAVFLTIRILVFKWITDEEAGRLLWVGGALKHGHDPNFLRPLVWPFMSVLDSMILHGAFLYGLNNGQFHQVLLRGVGLFIAVAIIAWRWRSGGRYLLLAYGFAFISFAVVFLGRGSGGVTHRTPHGYLEYGLLNDWYRISAWAGTIALLGIAASRIRTQWGRKVLAATLSLLVAWFIYKSYPRIETGDPFHGRGEMMARSYERMACLSKLNWSQKEIAFGLRYLFLPLAGSRPDGYWLMYEPGWLDLAVSGGEEVRTDPASIPDFDSGLARKLRENLTAVCGPDVFDAQIWRAVEHGKYPIEPTRKVDLSSVSNLAPLKKFELPSRDCVLSRYQVLELDLRNSEPVSEPIPIKINGLNLIIPRRDLGADGIHQITVDLRAIPPEVRCADSVEVELKDRRIVVLAGRLVPTPMNLAYYSKEAINGAKDQMSQH